MLDSSTPDLPDSIRYFSRPRDRKPVQPDIAIRRPARNRRMRARRTAAIMVAFGVVLGSVELLILLSYL